MSKVLVERPRVGGCGKENLRVNRHNARIACKMAIDDADIETPDFHGMKRVHTPSRHSYDDKKQPNENLRPLRRFLRSKIGQNWNKIYSEIMNGLNLNNAVQYHVWQHLIQFGEVQTKTYMEDGLIMGSGVLGPEVISDKGYNYRDEFYVDPRDGTLRCTEIKNRDTFRGNYKEREKSVLDNYRYINKKKPLVQYHVIGGVWYEYQMRTATEDESRAKSFFSHSLDFDTESFKSQYKWKKDFDNKFVVQLAADRRLEIPYWNYAMNLWEACNKLFDGTYLPTAKRQISSREVKKLRALMSDHKTCKKPHEQVKRGLR